MATHSNNSMLGKPHGQRSLVGISPWKLHKSQTPLHDWTAMAYCLDVHHSIFWMCKRKGGSQNIHSWGNGEILWSIFACLVMSDFATLWTVARLTFLSMGFFRQEYWRGLSFPSPGDLLDQYSFLLLLLLNCLFSWKAVASLYKNSTSKHNILQS